MRRPVGSNWDFTDSEWIAPLGFAVLAMAFGDFAWANGILFVTYLIVAAHIWFECKRIMPKKQHGSWLLYIVGAFLLNLYPTQFFMPIFAVIAYATFLGRLRKMVNADRIKERVYKERSQTFTRMFVLLLVAVMFYAGKTLLIVDDVKTLQKEQMMERGWIAPTGPGFDEMGVVE